MSGAGESCRSHVDADGVSGGSVKMALATVASTDAVVVTTKTLGSDVHVVSMDVL